MRNRAGVDPLAVNRGRRTVNEECHVMMVSGLSIQYRIDVVTLGVVNQ